MVISGFSIGSLAGTSIAQKNASVTSDFLSFMRQTPAERLQDQWLTSHKLTKEKLAAMSPDDRAAVMKQMQDDLEQQMKRQTENKKPGGKQEFYI